MTLQFGRLGTDITLNEHSTYVVGRRPNARMTVGKVAGEDDVTFGGWIIASTDADADAARQQLMGHIDNPWEPQVPFMWSTDPTQNGFLVPIDADVESVLGISYNQHAFRYAVKAKRMGGWNGAMMEANFNGTVLTNDHGILVSSGPTPWHGLPSAATLYDFKGRADTHNSRVGPGGAANVWNPGVDYYYSGYARYRLALSDYYAMASGIRVGSPLRYVTGRQINSVGNEALFELSNGLIKVEVGTGGASLAVSWPKYATPASWSTARQVDLGYFASAQWWRAGAPTNIAVVRNSPEMSILRLYFQINFAFGAATTHMTADLVLRRGSRTVQVVMRSPHTFPWGAALSTPTAMTTFGTPVQGFRQSADDGDGNRAVMHTSKTNTTDTTNARIYSTANRKTMDIGISGEIGGASAVAPDDYSTLNAMYFAAQTEYQRGIIP